MSISIEDIQLAKTRIGEQVLRTPCLKSNTLSQRLGCNLFIKFENQQFTASFKERGALNCLMAQQQDLSAGIITMSAGNHAQAVAYHGKRLGIPTTIVMPRSTPNAKVEATRVFGAEVILHGNVFEESRTYTLGLRDERGLTLIHPFDDELVIAGQGTIGLELLEQVDTLECVIVPIGGGGMISGIACAIKTLNPRVRIIGVQMDGFAGAFDLLSNGNSPQKKATVAEGIAVKAPGQITGALIKQWVDEIHLVSETEVEQAIFDLLEIEKTVAEGAGAAPLALLTRERELCKGQNVAMILSGGNIDMMILSSVLQRGLARTHRLIRLQVEVPDAPGALAALTAIVGEMDSNIVEIHHQRTFDASSVKATVIELVLQMRGEEQEDHVVKALMDAGYSVTAP